MTNILPPNVTYSAVSNDEWQEFLEVRFANGNRRIIGYDRLLFDVIQDVNATLLMSQIMYWFLPGKGDKKKTKWHLDKDNNRDCIRKSSTDWYKELGLSVKQVKRCLEILRNLDLIYYWPDKGNHGYSGSIIELNRPAIRFKCSCNVRTEQLTNNERSSGIV